MKIQFEEKQYESQMNMLLACQVGIYRNKSLFSPGQVLEGYIGFDAAMHSCNNRFWKYFYRDWAYLFYHYSEYWPYGLDLSDLHKFHRVFEEIYEHMPSIKYNVFIQYKKPKYLKKSNAPEYWKWEMPYFRYKLNEKQQKLLEKLSSAVGEMALVIYASPAFITQKEFWENVNNETMIENSNFCKAEELHGHHRYTYIRGGRHGIAFSEPEEISSINLKEEISKLNGLSEGASSNIEYINKLAAKLDNIILESDSDFSQYYRSRLKKFKDSEFSRRVDSRLFNSLVKINTFEDITGINIFNGI